MLREGLWLRITKEPPPREGEFPPTSAVALLFSNCCTANAWSSRGDRGVFIFTMPCLAASRPSRPRNASRAPPLYRNPTLEREYIAHQIRRASATLPPFVCRCVSLLLSCVSTPRWPCAHHALVRGRVTTAGLGRAVRGVTCTRLAESYRSTTTSDRRPKPLERRAPGAYSVAEAPLRPRRGRRLKSRAALSRLARLRPKSRSGARGRRCRFGRAAERAEVSKAASVVGRRESRADGHQSPGAAAPGLRSSSSAAPRVRLVRRRPARPTPPSPRRRALPDPTSPQGTPRLPRDLVVTAGPRRILRGSGLRSTGDAVGGVATSSRTRARPVPRQLLFEGGGLGFARARAQSGVGRW